MLEVGNMQVVLLKKRASSELDTYKIAIQKPRLVGVDTHMLMTQGCFVYLEPRIQLIFWSITD